MDTSGKSPKKGTNGAEVVVLISGKEDEEKTRKSIGESGESVAKLINFPSPEIGRFHPSPTPNKPPKIPNEMTRRRSFLRSISSKPKSRFGEQTFSSSDLNLIEETMSQMQASGSPYRNFSNQASPNYKLNPNTPRESSRIPSITPRTPLMASPGPAGGGEDDDEEIYKRVKSQMNEKKYKKVKAKALVEWAAFVCIFGCLLASLTIKQLEHSMLWGLEIWKWCVLVLVIFCGMLITRWFMHIIVFLIERNYLLRKKVLYFVHGLKKSVQVVIWLSVILFTWVLLFNHGVERSKFATRVLTYMTSTLIAILIGAILWLLKTLLLKILASSFHVNTFFDRIQESLFHQYILQTLSGPPVMETAEKVRRVKSTGQLNFLKLKKGGKGLKKKEVIDIGKLYQMKQEKVSAWTMKNLIDVVSSSGLSTISNTLDETFDDGGEQADKEITNEVEAMTAAYHIFRNVAQGGSSYLDEEDFMRFMIKEEVDLVFPLFEGSDIGRIDRLALTDWVVKVYKERKALAHALNDTKTAVKQLNKLVTGVLIVVIVIVWLLLMEIATTKVLVLLSSQLVVAAFMFGNTCKTIFESIIFVFVMHPFDVGDRCVVEGVQMVVEEMNILTTVFLRYDNEKIFYPNSVLLLKPISNYYRSPENMGDKVEFSIDVMTPVESIGTLKDRIKKYLERNSLHWSESHSVVVKEIEDVNKLKMALYVSHTMNFQNYGEKNARRSALVMELKRLFEELHIKYNLLPQQVLLKNPASTMATIAPR